MGELLISTSEVNPFTFEKFKTMKTHELQQMTQSEGSDNEEPTGGQNREAAAASA